MDKKYFINYHLAIDLYSCFPESRKTLSLLEVKLVNNTWD